MRKTREDYAVDIINYTLLILVGFITLYPFYYVVVCSFNDGLDLMRGGVYFWPRKISFAIKPLANVPDMPLPIAICTIGKFKSLYNFDQKSTNSYGVI